MAAMEKVFECMTCHAQIKLERKPDNSGWIRWNINGTPHSHPKNFQSSKTLERIEQVEAKINVLIDEVRSLRQEMQQQKK